MAPETKRSNPVARGRLNPRGNSVDSAHRGFLSPSATTPDKGGIRGLVLATAVGVVILLLPMAKTGIWDPIELRVADVASRVSVALLHAKLPVAAQSQPVTLPTLGEIGRGELPFTSIAVGFRMLGLHDWAGRLPLALWIVAALVATVAWVRRYINAKAAVWTALVFPSIPIVFFQARFMLGDAATIGTLTLSFVCLCFGCIDPPRAAASAITSRALWLLLGAAASAMGVLSRGLLIAVAVPFLAVGATVMLSASRCNGRRTAAGFKKVVALAILAVGVAATGVGVWITSRVAPQRGLGLILQGSNVQRNVHPFAFDFVISQLGHGLFPWSAVIIFAVAGTLKRLQSRSALEASQQALGAILVFLFVTVAAHTWLGSFGVALPFPAIAAAAAIIGIWLDAISERDVDLRIVLISALSILVMLVADYDNLPDKALAAIANTDAHIPVSFRKESVQWAQGCCAIIFGSALAFGFSFGENTRSLFGKEAFSTLVARGKALWRGQIGFYLLLIETALVTGALLLWATRVGIPLRRLKELGSPNRELLTWSWLILPSLVFVFVIGKWLLAAIDWIVSPGLGLPAIAKLNCAIGRVGSKCLARFPILSEITLGRGRVCAVGFLGAAAVFSLGWATRLGEHLSPRRALGRYESLSKPGEVLGLLGMRPQIIQYYSAQRPEVLLDADEAADWLLYGKNATRWMIVKGDQLPRLNAAYRERCHCLQNVPILDARSSDMLLASNRRIQGMRDENPYNDILLDHVPMPQQVLDADLGGQVDVLGWELVTQKGKAVAALAAGHKYLLRLYYKVTARPTLDWETFVHIDGYGRRYNGDHDTTQGLYPMTNWRPGDLIVDNQSIVLDPGFSRGNYQLYFGLYKGSRRLEVRRGRQDENRLIAGHNSRSVTSPEGISPPRILRTISWGTHKVVTSCPFGAMATR